MALCFLLLSWGVGVAVGENPGRGASVSRGGLGFVCGMGVMVHFLPAVARGVSGAGSGFRVGWRTGGLISIFEEFSSSFGEAFILAGGLGAGL